MCRKYENYKIKITYLNGDTEELNYKGINTNSYKEMLKLYKDVKEQHKEESVVIDFLGITNTGELGILFTKEVKGKDYLDKQELEMTEEEILKDIQRKMKLLKEKSILTDKLINIENKKQDCILHTIQNIPKNSSDELKIKMFNELQEIRINRCNLKTKQMKLESLNKNIKDNYLIDNIDKIIANYNKLSLKLSNIKQSYKFDKIEKVEEKFNVIKEIKYRNFKERANLMKQLTPKYDKVYDDYIKMTITCYNKGYKTA